MNSTTQTPGSKSPASNSRNPMPCILLVDDDHLILKTFGPALEKEGYQVTTTDNGEKAIDLITRKVFDLIITDLIIAPVDGVEILKKSKQNHPDTMVIILSDFSGMTSALDALRLGADDYLLKPCTWEGINFKVAGCFEKQALRRRLKRAEEALQKSEKRFREMADLMPNAIYETDRNLNVTYVNKIGLETFPFRQQNSDTDVNGISLIDRAEKALQKSKNRFTETADLLPNVICETDRNLNVTYVNKIGLETFPFRQQNFDTDINGMSLIHQDDKKIAAKHFNRVLKGETIKAVEYRMLARDGSQIHALLNIAPIYEDDMIAGTRISLMDISEQKKWQEDILKARKLESLGALAGGIAHDFNNLLYVIMGNITLAENDIRPEVGISENLREALKACTQTKNLTARLITFSKGGAPVKAITSIGDLVRDSVSSALSPFKIDTKFSIPDDILPVNIDESQMRQVFHNIAANAGEAMSAGIDAESDSGGKKRIKVYCENTDMIQDDTLATEKGKYVRISIEDQGCGIPEETIQRIFDPYFSTRKMGTDKGKGLGLAVCHSIIKKHDGRITVESKPDMGSTFHIYLPAIAPEHMGQKTGRDHTAIQSHIAKEQSSPQRILLMDDEEMVRKISTTMLNHIGYDAETAVDGVEAIEIYKKKMIEEPFDAIILDLTNQFGMGGVETMRKLLEINPEVKGIVATGYSNDPVVANFRAYGFRGTLTKPYTIDQLREALQKVL